MERQLSQVEGAEKLTIGPEAEGVACRVLYLEVNRYTIGAV